MCIPFGITAVIAATQVILKFDNKVAP